MRATAHTLCRWYLPTMSMLVYHAVDDWTTGSSSAEVCRFAQKHPSGMTWSTPERCETEVLLTAFSAVEVGGLGRVATAHQIAPWSEDLTCLSHHAVGAAFRSTSAECFSHFQSDTDVAQRRKLAGRTQQKVLSAASYRAGDGHGPIALEVRKTAAERAAESEPIY